MSEALTTWTRGWYLCIEFKIVCNRHGEDGENGEDAEDAEDAEDGEEDENGEEDAENNDVKG